MNIPYVRTKFEWYHPQITKFMSISAIISFVGMAIFVPLIKITRVSESLVLVLITASSVGAQFFIGLATKSWMIYLGNEDPNFNMIKNLLSFRLYFLAV